MDDYKNGIEKAKEIYRSIHPGGCRIISKGDSCVCFLCQCDHAVDRHLTQQHNGLANLVEKAQVITILGLFAILASWAFLAIYGLVRLAERFGLLS